MSVEFTTPVPVTLQHMRFVFFFVEQPVADSFDNIPQFYLDISEKAEQSNIQRLYVCCKPNITFETFIPKEDDEINQVVTETYKDFIAYVKKYFGSKFLVLETMHNVFNSNDTKAVPAIISSLYATAYTDHMFGNPDHFTASSNPKTDDAHVKVSPSSLCDWHFNFYTKEPNSHCVIPPICQGNAVLFGEPMIFTLERQVYLNDSSFRCYRLLSDTIRKFITPSLLETVVNNAIRNAIGHPATKDDKYIYEVEITNE